jgi:beta-glucosidase
MKTHLLHLGIACVALATGTAALAATDFEPRIEELLRQMTLEEKIHLLAGDTSDFNAQGLPRLGIPSIPMGDGPAGIRIGHSTAFPSPINLAASWDVALASEFGDAIAAETLAKGRSCILGPCVGINRFPLNGATSRASARTPASPPAWEWASSAPYKPAA